MNRSVAKKNAAVFLILLVGILFLLAVYPLRLFTTTATLTGEGTIVASSDPVDADNDAGDYFTAQYSHLDILETWIEEVEKEGSVTLRLFHVKGDGSLENLAEEEQQLPQEKGFVSFPIDVDTVPGDTYIYILYANDDAVFRSGYESAAIPDREDAIWYQSGFYHDTGVDGVAVATRLTYRIPLPKMTSLFLMGGILLAMLAAVGIALLYYRKPGRNKATTVFQVLRWCVTPPATILAVAAMIAVFPFRIYDNRALDCVVYEIGIVLSWCMLMYGLWHKREENISASRILPVRHLLIILFLAMAISATCDYMNAVNDLIHAYAEYRMLLFLFLVILLMGGLRGIQRILVPVAGAFGALYGALHYRANAADLSDPEHAYKNLILFILAAAIAAGTMAVTALVCTLVQHVADRGQNRISWNRPLIIMAGTFMVLMFVFRNGRSWVTILILLFLLFLLRYALWEEKERWTEDLTYGIALQFVFTVVFSLLHRYYFAYLYSRFSLIFHTVTVTSYYLLAVSSLSTALLVCKLPAVYRRKNQPLTRKLDVIWKEVLFFGVTSSYMLMTLTRAGIGGLILVVLAACLFGLWDRELPLQPLKGLGTLLLIFVITLPAVFTLQRIVPVTVRDPQHFEEVEPYPDEVNRNMRPDSRWFMSVEIFVRDIGDRIIGGELGTKIYIHFDWNQRVLHNDKRLFSMNPEKKPLPSLVRSFSPLLAEAGETIPADNLETGDYSNGRVTIWQAYLSELNLTGHDSMNVPLPDGSLAVHAHNTTLQLAFDCGIPTGLIGIAFFVSLLGFAVQRFRKEKRFGHREQSAEKTAYFLFVLLALLGFLLTGLVEWIFHLCNPFTVILMLAVLPLFLRDDSTAKESENPWVSGQEQRTDKTL